MATLQFDMTDEGKKRYEICVQALTMAGSKIGARSPQPAEWDDYISLLRKLKQHGEEVDIPQMPGMIYELKEDVILPLERAEMRLLQEFIQQPIWKPAHLERVAAVRDWLAERAKNA